MSDTSNTTNPTVTINGRARELSSVARYGADGNGMSPKRINGWGTRAMRQKRVAELAANFSEDQLRAWAASRRASAEVERTRCYTYNGGKDLIMALRVVYDSLATVAVVEAAADLLAA